MAASPAPAVILLSDRQLAESAERSAAAAGLRILRSDVPHRKTWLSAAAVVLDRDSARDCVRAGMPRRDGVVLVDSGEPDRETWSVAVAVGAQHLCLLPAQEANLVRILSDVADLGGGRSPRGSVIAVTAGRGGAGASVFAAALAQAAGEALLVDLDTCSGGIDLLMGAESAPGLRWPDLRLQGGRLHWAAVREVLPRRGGVTLLSSAREYCDISSEAATAVVDAARRSGTTVICDVPRQPAPMGGQVLEAADLVVIVAPCDVRSIAATAASASVLRTVNPHLGLVVRGPAPGGLSADEAVDVSGVPLLAAMRPEPMLDRRLEQGGLRLGRRSPLAAAARAVLVVVDGRGQARAA